MNREELAVALERLGLEIGDTECDDIVEAFHFVEEMANSVRKPRSVMVEPAHLPKWES